MEQQPEIRNGFVVTRNGRTEIHAGTETPKYTLYSEQPVPRGCWATVDVYQSTPDSRFWDYTLHFYDDLGQERGMPECSSMWPSEERALNRALATFEQVIAAIRAYSQA